jgi:hypothetical protein
MPNHLAITIPLTENNSVNIAQALSIKGSAKT